MAAYTDYLIKIAIADDHKIFRDGIKMALSGKENLKMLWEAADGKITTLSNFNELLLSSL